MDPDLHLKCTFNFTENVLFRQSMLEKYKYCTYSIPKYYVVKLPNTIEISPGHGTQL